MKLYKDVISEAWQFTVKHANLWILGLFATLIVGTGGEIDRYLRYVNSLVSDGSFLSLNFWAEQRWFIALNNVLVALQAGNAQAWTFFILLLASMAVVVYMAMVAEGGLIHMADRKQVTFVQAFKHGHTHAAQLFVLNMITYLSITLLTLLMVTVVANIGITDNGAEQYKLLLFVGSIFLIPLVLIVSFIARYAANYIVLQNEHLWEALQAGGKLFFNNILVTVEMAIIVFVIALAVNIAIVLVAALVTAPYLATVTMVPADSVSDQLFNGIFVGTVVYALELILFSAIFSTWQWSAWTILFKRVQSEKHHSKLVRIFSKPT